jgi:hypothetical protein
MNSGSTCNAGRHPVVLDQTGVHDAIQRLGPEFPAVTGLRPPSAKPVRVAWFAPNGGLRAAYEVILLVVAGLPALVLSPVLLVYALAGASPSPAQCSSTSAASARMARSSHAEFRLMVRYNLFSIDNWSLSLVRFIFLRAAPAVLRRSEV